MAKKPRRSKPLKGTLTTKVDVDPPEDDAFTYVLICDGQVIGKGSSHEDVLDRLTHFLRHATVLAIMKKCGLESIALRGKTYGVLDRERGRIVTNTDAPRIINPRTGRVHGGH